MKNKAVKLFIIIAIIAILLLVLPTILRIIAAIVGLIVVGIFIWIVFRSAKKFTKNNEETKETS